MRKSKLVKFLLPLTLGILLFSFASTVRAKPGDITIRPLDDWIEQNRTVLFRYECHKPGTEDKYAIDLRNPYPDSYDGYIKVRELPDGRAEFTVYINFQHKHALCSCSTENPTASTEEMSDNIFEEGLTVTGRVVSKFILDGPYAEIPLLLDMWLEGALVSRHIVATGYGTFSAAAGPHGFTPGATGKVIINHHSLHFAGSQNEFRPPNKADVDWGLFIPVEQINVLEIEN